MAKKNQVIPFLTPQSPKSIYDSKEVAKLYSKLDQWQLGFIQSIHDHIVTSVDAVAGSGKTTLSLMVALEMLSNNIVNKIVYLRLPTARSLSQGFLPGTAEEKQSILMQPFFDAARELGVQRQTLDAMVDDETLVLCSDLGMRGTNIKDAFVIFDEVQESDIGDLQLVLTRCHDNCKVVLCGHTLQRDNKQRLICGMSAFQLYSLHLSKKSFANSCELCVNYRGKLSQHADAIQDTIAELKEGKVTL